MNFGTASSPIRKLIKHKLKSGQTITVSPGDDRMLRSVYDYLQGCATRELLTKQLESKREELLELGLNVENTFPISKMRQGSSVIKSGTMSKISSAPTAFKNQNVDDYDQNAEIMFDQISRSKDEYKLIENDLISHLSDDHKISYNDIEAMVKRLGIQNPQKRWIDQMIWEVDDLADEVICWDEFQLAYRRSIDDITGNEPSSFFRLLEFLTFDHSRKGYIIEDDCMEILFVRYGSSKLEKELKSIFGDQLRSMGGDGTLTLEAYLAACQTKTGRRAPLF